MNIKIFLHKSGKFFKGRAVQILYNTVVIHNFKLVVGESHCKKIIKFIIASVSGIFLSAQLSYLNGRGTSVMTVGNIHTINTVKGIYKLVNNAVIINNPHGLAHTICVKIINRLVFAHPH